MSGTQIGFSALNTYTAQEVLEGKGSKLGTMTVDDKGNVYIFVLSAGTIANAGDVCFIQPTFSVSRIVTSSAAATAGEPLGVAQAAFAAGEYGWLMIKGITTIRVAASCAANVALNTTATAGLLDDDGTAGSYDIVGMTLTTANGGSTSSVAGVINYPTVALVAN